VSESFDLAWTHVRANRGQTTDNNCVALGDTSEEFRIVNGTIRLDWQPGDVNTTTTGELNVRAGPGLEERVRRDIEPGEHTVNVTGWGLANPEFTVSLFVAINAPEPAYASVDNQATFTFDWQHTGTYDTFLEGTCTVGGLE